jgi:hypothetical protein
MYSAGSWQLAVGLAAGSWRVCDPQLTTQTQTSKGRGQLLVIAIAPAASSTSRHKRLHSKPQATTNGLPVRVMQALVLVLVLAR